MPPKEHLTVSHRGKAVLHATSWMSLHWLLVEWESAAGLLFWCCNKISALNSYVIIIALFPSEMLNRPDFK